MADTTEVQRGSFDKDGTRFDVCASSAMAPEAMRVYQAGDRSVIALVVSGLNSGELKASWGSGWGAYPEEWRDDFEERAYRAYVSRVRVCNG